MKYNGEDGSHKNINAALLVRLDGDAIETFDPE